MGKRFKILLVIISLSLTLGLMSNTYSRYVAAATGNVEMAFAKWQILVNNNDITSNETSSITLTPIIEANQHIAANTIAPSSKGYFDIIINPENVDVSFNYSIGLDVINENMPDLLISKYSLIDNNYVQGTTLEEIIIQDNAITGTLNYDNSVPDFTFTPFTIRVYFEWYEGDNELMDNSMDTAIGNDAATNETSLEIGVNITFEQNI